MLVKNQLHQLLTRGSGKVHYKIRYDPACSGKKPPRDISVALDYFDVTGKKALNLMKKAVDLKGKDYKFSVTYLGSKTGFVVVKLNEVENTKTCVWIMSTRSSKGSLRKLRSNDVSNLFVREDNTLVMTYQKK